jgi:hypothetical protein
VRESAQPGSRGVRAGDRHLDGPADRPGWQRPGMDASWRSGQACRPSLFSEPIQPCRRRGRHRGLLPEHFIPGRTSVACYAMNV